MINAGEINKMLADYMKSDSGKKEIAAQTGITFEEYSTDKMKLIAQELSDMIVDAYLSEVKHTGKYFDKSLIRIGVPSNTTKGKVRLRITFDKKALFRQSLVVGDGSYGYGSPYKTKYPFTSINGFDYYATGEGVYDIVGLLTQGYSTKPVYGYWWDNKNNNEGSGHKIKNKRTRSGSDFVTRAVNNFKLKYPNIDVVYPKLWGGTK